MNRMTSNLMETLFKLITKVAYYDAEYIATRSAVAEEKGKSAVDKNMVD